MATSQRSRVRKPESVQFWLCVGTVSLALHSSLLFGLQRWARVTIVRPDESPSAIELVDAPETVVSQVEPDVIAQVLQKPDSKPAAQPEVAAPEVKLDVKPDVRPEPDTVREPKALESPIGSSEKPSKTPEKPKAPEKKAVISKIPKPTKNPRKTTTSSPSPTPREPSGSKTPATSNDRLPGQISGGGVRSVGLKFTRPEQEKQQGAVGDVGDADATLMLTEFPGTLQVSNNFPGKAGQDFDVKVGFAVSCENSVGSLCNPSMAKIGEPSVRPPDGIQLSASEDIELESLIKQIFQNVRVSQLTVQTSVDKKPDTFWSVTIRIR